MSIRTIILGTTMLAAIPAAHAQELPAPSRPGVPATTPVNPVNPGSPTVTTRPIEAPRSPLAPAPIQPPAPARPIACLPNAGPGPIAVSASPTSVCDGVPVTLTVSFQCPWPTSLTGAYPVTFTASSSSTDRDAGNTMIAFLNQLPRTQVRGGAPSVSASFTPRGLAASVTMQLRAQVETPRALTSPAIAVSITGSGQSAPTTPTTPTADGCRPTLGLNALESGVTAGGRVRVDLTLSCALSGPAVVQILSSQPNLVLPPPGGTVTIPAGRTTFRVELDSSRTENGASLLRAVLSQPAGNMTTGDEVRVN